MNDLQLNKKRITNSIWLLLPVAITCAEIIAIVHPENWQTYFLIPFGILTYGAFIWVPSILFVYVLEYFTIQLTARKERILVVFGVETLITFIRLLLIFGIAYSFIAFIGLGMSILTQITRWFFINYKGQLYKEKKT